MWTFIYKKDVNNYLLEHLVLSDNFDQFCLLETKDTFFLPRLFYYNYPSKYLQIYHGKEQINSEKVNFKFVKKLKPLQSDITSSVLKLYEQNNYVNGIIKAITGGGKTVLAIYLAHKIGLKTNIIVDNSGLMKQWIGEILEFTDLKKEDIGIVQQKLCVTSKPVCISMVHTLCSKIKTNVKSAFSDLDNGFGLVIYDEVHASSATHYFSTSSLLFRTPNIIGLSATPFHTGVQDILMKNTIGNLIYETTEYELTPNYTFVYYDSGLGGRSKESYIMTKMSTNIMKKGYYNKIISNSNRYFEIIKEYTDLLYRQNHRIMIICMTKVQVKTVSDYLTRYGLINRKYYGDEKDDIDEINDKIIVATYKFCGKGFNYKALSAMILATPLAGKKSIIQAVGRILRNLEGKNKPTVIDLIDVGFPTFFIPEVNIKKRIIENEYNVSFEEVNKVKK